MVRKGMGKGKGKGYKNIQGRDSRIHSQSAKGIKTAQKLSPRVEAMLKKNPKLKNKTFKQLQKKGVFLKYQGDVDGDGVKNVKDCRPLNPKMHRDERVKEIEFDPSVENEVPKTKKFLGKAKAFIGKEARATKEFAKTKLEERRIRKEKQKIEELESVNHPLVKKLTKQKKRVDTIKTQIAETDDESKEEELFNELEVEQNQLREQQEKVTKIGLVDFSDKELKTLAIRWKDDSFFGGDNPYSKELARRIRAEKTIEEELKEVRKEKPSEGFFDDLF